MSSTSESTHTSMQDPAPATIDMGLEVVTLVAPRPLLLCSATEDKYSADAPVIADAAASAYEALGAGPALRHERFAGGHALTEERFDAIVRWTVARASGDNEGGYSV